jgi:hypothetical protein
MSKTVPSLNNRASGNDHLRINNDLETINQVLYLVSVELSSEQTRLKGFVGVGQSALRRVADAFASFDRPR